MSDGRGRAGEPSAETGGPSQIGPKAPSAGEMGPPQWSATEMRKASSQARTPAEADTTSTLPQTSASTSGDATIPSGAGPSSIAIPISSLLSPNSLPRRQTVRPHTELGYNLNPSLPIGEPLPSLPIRRMDDTRGESSGSHLMGHRTFDGFLSAITKRGHNSRSTRSQHIMNRRHINVLKSAGVAVTRERYQPPELLLSEGLPPGRLWAVFEGELRLPRSAVDVAATEQAVPEVSMVDLALAMGKMFEGMGLALTDDAPNRAEMEERSAKMEAKANKATTVKRSVAVKFACPANLARTECKKRDAGCYPPSSPNSSDGTEDPDDVYDNEWRFSEKEIEARILNEARLYCTNFRALQGKVVPHYYGLWSFEIREGTVYMMVLEYLERPEENLDREVDEIEESVQKRICKAFSALHEANVVVRDIDMAHIRVESNATNRAIAMMDRYSAGAADAVRPREPPSYKVIDFDEAVDISNLPPEERRAAIMRDRWKVEGQFHIDLEVDLWGRYYNILPVAS